MSETRSERTSGPDKRQWFVTTSWSNLMAARQKDSPDAKAALETLCTTYWYPLYAYVRRLGYNPTDAEDLTQSFFCQLLEKNYLGAVDRKRGKFRSFLLAALNHFLSNHRDFHNAAKRGGGKTVLSLDEKTAEDLYLLEPASDLSPEKIFEARWATTVVSQARKSLQHEYEQAGKGDQFRQLESFLSEEPASGDYAAAAARLQTTSGAVAVAVHRLRQRYGETVRSEVARTVVTASEVESEMRHLCSVLGTSVL